MNRQDNLPDTVNEKNQGINEKEGCDETHT